MAGVLLQQVQQHPLERRGRRAVSPLARLSDVGQVVRLDHSPGPLGLPLQGLHDVVEQPRRDDGGEVGSGGRLTARSVGSGCGCGGCQTPRVAERWDTDGDTDRGVDSRTVVVDGLRMHVRTAGEGPPVVLLHGWPQTGLCWRYVAPELVRAGYRVVVPDLRGYGHTDKPTGGYDKRTMAGDVRGLLAVLGLAGEPVHVVGHDRGARVAHRWALDAPDELRTLTVLDIVPTLTMITGGSMRTARAYWHWLFHLQPDLPELLVGPAVETYLRYLLDRWTVQRGALADAVDDYVRAFTAPGALRAGFDDYRALDEDVAQDQASADAGQRLALPVLALWGDGGLPAQLPVLDVWREYATDVRGGAVADCGHFVPEEQPAELVARLLELLRGA